MTSKLVVNTIEADTGISSVSFASSISMNSTSKFHFSAAGVDIGADTNINRPASGVLGFNINSSEKVRIGSAGQIGIAGANYGSSGQVLTSGGSGSAVSWTTITGTTINNNADNRVITGSGTANTLNAESTLTWSGVLLDLFQNTTAETGLKIRNSEGSCLIRTNDDKTFVDTDELIIRNEASTERLRIKSDGKVGVGTDGPSQQFTSYAASGYPILANGPSNGIGLGGNGVIVFGNKDLGSYASGAIDASDFAIKTSGNEKLRINSDGDLMVGTTGSSGAKIQIGNHTFAGTNFAYNNDRVGFQNNGHLTCISNCSTYNDGNHPGYGFVLVQGASTSSYNTWGICPDGPAKGNSLNFHYGAQATNIHDPSLKKFQFTGEGYALTPNMPYCMLGRGSNQSVANTTGTKIIFDTKNVDRGSNYNTSNGRFTAPVAGDYLLCLIVEYVPSTGVGQCHTGMWRNGVHNFGYSSFDAWNNFGNDNKGGSMVVVANLAQNDYIEFATYHNSGSTQQLSSSRTKATIRFLG